MYFVLVIGSLQLTVMSFTFSVVIIVNLITIDLEVVSSTLRLVFDYMKVMIMAAAINIILDSILIFRLLMISVMISYSVISIIALVLNKKLD